MWMATPPEILALRTVFLQTRPAVPYAPSEESAKAKRRTINDLVMAVDRSFLLFRIVLRPFVTFDSMGGAIAADPLPIFHDIKQPGAAAKSPSTFTLRGLLSLGMLRTPSEAIVRLNKISVKFPKKHGVNARVWKGEAFSKTFPAEDNGGKWAEVTRLRAEQCRQLTDSRYGSYKECQRGGRRGHST